MKFYEGYIPYLIIILLLILLLILLFGMISYAAVTTDILTQLYEDGCKDIGMDLLNWEFQGTTPIIICYLEGTDKIKRFKSEVKE